MSTISRHSFTAEHTLPDLDAPPRGELTETEFAYLVDAVLPGVRRADLTVDLRDGELVIRGLVRRRHRTGLLRWRTDCAGRLDYRLALPEPVEPGGTEVRVLAGILSIRIPKRDKTAPAPATTPQVQPAVIQSGMVEPAATVQPAIPVPVRATASQPAPNRAA